MTDPVKPALAPVEAISLDDLRHKALAIREEVKDEAHEQILARRTQIVLVGVLVVVAAVSIAYFVGTRSARPAPQPPIYY
jgi:hypothetical protein